eukprot:1063419-Amorphochlora_amoeboformis.AAC.1
MMMTMTMTMTTDREYTHWAASALGHGLLSSAGQAERRLSRVGLGSGSGSGSGLAVSEAFTLSKLRRNFASRFPNLPRPRLRPSRHITIARSRKGSMPTN